MSSGIVNNAAATLIKVAAEATLSGSNGGSGSGSLNPAAATFDAAAA